MIFGGFLVLISSFLFKSKSYLGDLEICIVKALSFTLPEREREKNDEFQLSDVFEASREKIPRWQQRGNSVPPYAQILTYRDINRMTSEKTDR